MSKKEKLINRLKQKPKDFTYEEARTILNYYGFIEYNKGKTSGSRVIFIHKQTGLEIMLHRPHPSNVLKHYQIEILLEAIKKLEEIV